MLVLLQIGWHCWWMPPERAPRVLVLTLYLLPLLPALAVFVRNPRRGLLLAGMASLFYFCHGVAESWTDADARPLALVETAVALLLIGALGWDARGYRRRRD
jgi:uncharacterized membrane protein